MNKEEAKRYIEAMYSKYERETAEVNRVIDTMKPNHRYLADAVVYIGRFQPFHRGHLATLKLALQLGNTVVVALGSVQDSRTKKNPFTAIERVQMIQSCLGVDDILRLRFIGLYDNLASDEDWAKQVKEKTQEVLGDRPKATICLIGVHKDDSSRYLDWFPDWKFVEGPTTELLNATDIRNLLSSGVERKYWSAGLPESVADYIEAHNLTKEFNYE